MVLRAAWMMRLASSVGASRLEPARSTARMLDAIPATSRGADRPTSRMGNASLVDRSSAMWTERTGGNSFAWHADGTHSGVRPLKSPHTHLPKRHHPATGIEGAVRDTIPEQIW